MPTNTIPQVQPNTAPNTAIQKTSILKRIIEFLIKNKLISIAIFGGLFLIIIFIIILLFVNKPQPVVTPPEPQPITLKLWSYTENAEHYKKIIDDYHTENPLVTVEFEQRPEANYRDILQQRIIQNSSTVPDIFELDSKDVAYFQPSLAPAPSSVLTLDEYQTLYFSQMQNDNAFNNLIYGVPTGTDGLMLVYNSSLVKANEIPTYWTDFIKFAQSKTIVNTEDLTKNIQNGIAVSDSSKTLYMGELAQLLLLQNKLKTLYDPNGSQTISINTNAGIDSLNIYLQLISKKPWDESSNNSLEAFINGNTAFAIIKANDIYTIKSRKPSLPFKTHVMPIISEQIYWSSYTSYAVSGQSPNAIEAWKFLKYLASEKIEKDLYDTADQYKLAKKPYAVKSIINDLQKDELLAPIGTMSPNMANWINPDRIKINKVFTELFTGRNIFTDQDISALNTNLNSALQPAP